MSVYDTIFPPKKQHDTNVEFNLCVSVSELALAASWGSGSA